MQLSMLKNKEKIHNELNNRKENKYSKTANQSLFGKHCYDGGHENRNLIIKYRIINKKNDSKLKTTSGNRGIKSNT